MSTKINAFLEQRQLEKAFAVEVRKISPTLGRWVDEQFSRGISLKIVKDRIRRAAAKAGRV